MKGWELRQLVERAMRCAPDPREWLDAAYRFLSLMAGNLPRLEEAVRELYRGNQMGYLNLTADGLRPFAITVSALPGPTANPHV